MKITWDATKAKEEFKKEVEKINNESWRKACLELVEKLPDYFWTVPASSSGKYHPECDLGDGGLVRHSLMVTKVGMDLMTAEIFLRGTNSNFDKVRIACLFHDCMKQGLPEDNNEHTVFMHPMIASDFLRKNLNIDEYALDDICGAIESHMGKWVTSKYEPDNHLHRPRTDMEILVHTADYMASRKYINGIDSWVEEN